mgnify:CR=1 FL=1
MLYEVLGDIWVVIRNPYLEEDLLQDPHRRQLLIEAMRHRLSEVNKRRDLTDTALNESVGELIELASAAVARFEKHFVDLKIKREQIAKTLSKYTRRRNICFDAYARAAHVTDATDWRVAYPIVVLYPDAEEEIPGLVRACDSLGLTLIGRGGSTGYTGGAVPLSEMTADWETKLLQIERGEMEPETFMTEIKEMISSLVTTTEARKGASALMKNKIIGVCPNCGANVVEREKGWFCESNPCRFVLWKDNAFFKRLGKRLDGRMADKLLRDGRVRLKDCKSAKGKTYNATVLLSCEADGRSKFSLEFEGGY